MIHLSPFWNLRRQTPVVFPVVLDAHQCAQADFMHGSWLDLETVVFWDARQRATQLYVPFVCSSVGTRRLLVSFLTTHIICGYGCLRRRARWRAALILHVSADAIIETDEAV